MRADGTEMVHLRVARASDREELPLHWEGAPLSPPLRAIGLTAGLLLAAVGIAVMVRRPGFGLEVAAAMAAALGVMAAVLASRCRRFETVVGDRWIAAGAGPLVRRVARQLVATAQVRPATSWRSLYADQEVVLRLLVAGEQVVVPSRTPEELLAALELEVADGDRAG